MQVNTLTINQMTLYYLNMTTATISPGTKPKVQYRVARNVDMMLSARHLKKKDLASAMGMAPASMSKKLRGEIVWTIDDVQNAADFLGTDIMTLLKEQLDYGELFGDGGQLVGSDAGRRQRGSGEVEFALAA